MPFTFSWIELQLCKQVSGQFWDDFTGFDVIFSEPTNQADFEDCYTLFADPCAEHGIDRGRIEGDGKTRSHILPHTTLLVHDHTLRNQLEMLLEKCVNYRMHINL